jgi:hypothetical protein
MLSVCSDSLFHIALWAMLSDYSSCRWQQWQQQMEIAQFLMLLLPLPSFVLDNDKSVASLLLRRPVFTFLV